MAFGSSSAFATSPLPFSSEIHYIPRMETLVSASDANRSFSRLLTEVRHGATYVVTTHGTPVARIVPWTQADEARASAQQVLMAQLEAQPVIDIGSWTRDALYDR